MNPDDCSTWTEPCRTHNRCKACWKSAREDWLRLWGKLDEMIEGWETEHISIQISPVESGATRVACLQDSPGNTILIFQDLEREAAAQFDVQFLIGPEVEAMRRFFQKGAGK